MRVLNLLVPTAHGKAILKMLSALDPCLSFVVAGFIRLGARGRPSQRCGWLRRLLCDHPRRGRTA